MLDACAAPGEGLPPGRAAPRRGGGPLRLEAGEDPGRGPRRLGLTDRVEVWRTTPPSRSPTWEGGRSPARCAMHRAGTLRRHPELRWRRSEEDVLRLATLQRRILERCQEQVPPGGLITYAVCSTEPEEGQDQVELFLGAIPTSPPSLRRWPSASAGRNGRATSAPSRVRRAWTVSSPPGCGGSPEQEGGFRLSSGAPGRKMPRPLSPPGECP